MLVPPSSPPAVLRSLVIGGLAASLLAITVSSAALATRPHAQADACATGIDTSSLTERDRTLVARRTLACSDVEHGRITQDEYRDQIAKIDAAWTTPVMRIPAGGPISAPITMQYASTVRGFSTQYSATSWSADRVLGPPDVYPAHGDNSNAWASLGADDQDEWLEVGYGQPMPVGAIDIYETYNPGAITSIEMITVSGKHITAYQGFASSRGETANKLHVDVGCSAEPIVAIKVGLASTKVAGWNEIDAIGIAPCADQ